MNKKIISMLFCMLPITSHANSIYDGIWESSPRLAYITVKENLGSIVASFNYISSGTWDASSGVLDGNKVRLTTLIGHGKVVVDVVFNSATEASAHVISCTPDPGYVCSFPAGASFTGKKVW
jgi:hypothetical protein